MDPTKALRDIWAWIPAFRVVAETEHLPTAAARLHVSASALSRTVKLVEDALGEALFVRGSRRMVLNAAGKRLLEAVRRSMTGLEHAMPGVLGREFTGEYQASSLGVLTDHFVLPALLELERTHPLVIPTLMTLQSKEANRQLSNGQIEVAFYYDATAAPGIACRRIGSLPNSVYCGRGHPLFGSNGASMERILAHEFSVASVGDRGTPMDGWPVELPRKVGLRIMMLSTNHQVALSGRFLCVLPDVVAHRDCALGRLWRVSPEPVPDTEVYAACREEDAESSFTSSVIAEVERRIAAAPTSRERPAATEPRARAKGRGAKGRGARGERRGTRR